jgi:hypothetical protein
MASETERRGSCLCGAVRLAIQTTSKSVAACHCSMCRTLGGGPLLALECGTEVHFDGTDSISVFSSSDWAERGFCSKCGTHLFYRLKKEGESKGSLIHRFLVMRNRHSTCLRMKQRT